VSRQAEVESHERAEKKIVLIMSERSFRGMSICGGAAWRAPCSGNAIIPDRGGWVVRVYSMSLTAWNGLSMARTIFIGVHILFNA
jgi:hypothetical protein